MMKKTEPDTRESFLLKRREPQSFMLWLGIFGITLMFLILTGIYVLRVPANPSDSFRLPSVFWASTVVILASSLSLHGARQAFRRAVFARYRVLIAVTFCLGVLFVAFQFVGWNILYQQKIHLNKSTSGAFLYIISGLHIAHILAGLFFLAVALFQAVRRKAYVDSFIYSVNPPNQLRFKLVSLYWHFVDVLWIYLFLFFLYHHS